MTLILKDLRRGHFVLIIEINKLFYWCQYIFTEGRWQTIAGGFKMLDFLITAKDALDRLPVAPGVLWWTYPEYIGLRCVVISLIRKPKAQATTGPAMPYIG